MGMMIHRNKKRRAEKQAALAKNAENPMQYTDETPQEYQYTKTEINRMTTAELQELADKVGIENAFETSGGELKKILIEHFNL